jgi:phosphoadenosine phosphosulfate reductase
MISRADAVHARSRAFLARAERAREVVREFAAGGHCYAGVSWGKDSTVLAHLVAECAPEIPLVWVRVEPIKNPDCVLVRDSFLCRYRGCRYEEIVVWCERGGPDGWHATGTLERGFREAVMRHGARRMSGVRGAESGTRKRSLVTHGIATATTARPIGWWEARDVWAYLEAYDLPVHPAYACSQAGTWDRDWIRVASLGGHRGDGVGRREWEERYYGAELAELRGLSAK